jgi:hypothetical protein
VAGVLTSIYALHKNISNSLFLKLNIALRFLKLFGLFTQIS